MGLVVATAPHADGEPNIVRRTIGVLPEPPPEGGFGIGLAAFAKQLWWERRWRTRFFPAELFGEPSWDLLLAGYAHEKGEASESAAQSGKPHLDACSPPLVAARHVRQLAELHLLEKGVDLRRSGARVILTAQARERMGMLLGNILLQRTLAAMPGEGGPGGDEAGGEVELAPDAPDGPSAGKSGRTGPARSARSGCTSQPCYRYA